jgi:hypothetical protein
MNDQAGATICTFHDCSVDAVGSPESLVDDDLVLPEWLPAFPKRLAIFQSEAERD